MLLMNNFLKIYLFYFSHLFFIVSAFAVDIGSDTAVTRFSTQQEINNGGISEASKAGILQKLATTVFIEAERRGL